jgi:hypothetical protein
LRSFLAAADIGVPEKKITDGINLFPHWSAGESVERCTMFFDMSTYQHQRLGPVPDPNGFVVAIKEDMKLILNNKTDRVPVALFNLHADPGELLNLIDRAEHTELVRELHRELKSWLDDPTAATASTTALRPAANK